MSKSGWKGFWWRGRLPPKPPSGAESRALPAPAAPPASEPTADSVAAEAEALVQELHQAARAAGVGPDDPMHPFVQCIDRTIRFMASRIAGSDRAMAEACQRIVEALTLAKATADAERKRIEVLLANAEVNMIARVGEAGAVHIDAAVKRYAHAFYRRTALITAAVLVLTAGSGLGGGYWWGARSALADVHQTEAGLRAAFNGGPADAAIWMSLMEWNPIRGALEQCAKPGVGSVQDGRKACGVPLWVGPPHPTAPQ